MKLGQQELTFEDKVRELQQLAREAGRAGRFAESAAAWELRNEVQATLAKVQAEITQIGRILYAARTRQSYSRLLASSM